MTTPTMIGGSNEAMTDADAIEELERLSEDAPLYRFSIRHAIDGNKVLAKARQWMARFDDTYPAKSRTLIVAQRDISALRELLKEPD